MKYNFITILLLLFAFQASAKDTTSNKGYNIELDIPSKPNKLVYWVSYWEDSSYAVDSVTLSDTGKGVLKGEKNLGQGQYLLYIKPDVQLDILIGEDTQDIKIFVDPASIKNCKIEGSKDTENLWKYLQKQAEYLNTKSKIEKKINELDGKGDKKLQEKLISLFQQFQEYSAKLISDNKETWSATFIKGMQPAVTPYLTPQNEEEQIENYRYLKQHYLDNIDLQDSRMWATNYLTSSIDTYLTQIVEQNPDTIAEAASALVKKSSGNDYTFQRMLSKFINESQKSNIMGKENTWAKLFEEYILNQNLNWIDSATHSQLHMNYELIKNNLLGMTAKDMLLTTIDDKVFHTNEVEADFIILYFFDTSCSHCITDTPILRDIANTYKDKGVRVIAINIRPNQDKTYWQEYITKNELTDWINCSDPEYKSQFWLNYDTSGTPTFYILNKEKTIIAKKIGTETIPKILDMYIIK